MAESDKKGSEGKIDIAAELAALKEQNAELQAKVEKLSSRPPTKEEMKSAREKADAAKKAAAAKRDAEAEDTVVIQKFNRDGDLTRERTCAKVDVKVFEQQGFVVKKS